MSISSGSLVTVAGFGKILWVVVAPADDGRRFVCRGKRVDGRGRYDTFSRTVGVGDITLIREAETYQPGVEIEHGGKLLTVIEDLGDEVEFEVPASFRPLRGGGALRIAAGITATIYKADLTLENMR